MLQTPIPTRLRFTCAPVFALLAAGAILPGLARGATPPPPNVSIAAKVVEGDPTSGSTVTGGKGSPGDSGSPTNQGSKKGGGNQGGATPKTISSNSATSMHVEFTIKNIDQNLPATGLDVTWHVYTKTTLLSGSQAKVTMKELTGTQTIDSIPAKGNFVINSDNVEKSESSTVSSSSNNGGGGGGKGGKGGGNKGGGGGSSSGSSSSEATVLAGYYIEVSSNGKVIFRFPRDAADKQAYDAYVKSHPNG